MSSEVDICNMILIPLGVDRISSLSEDSEQAKKLNELYPSLRDRELCSHTWSFATDRVALALVSDSYSDEFQYQLQLPVDCLRVINIDTNDWPYRVEGDKLLTNYINPSIKYIKRVTDTNKFSQAFIDVLVARGQYELAYVFTGSKTMTGDLFKMYQLKRRLYLGVDSQSSGTPYKLSSDRLISSRYGVIY